MSDVGEGCCSKCGRSLVECQNEEQREWILYVGCMLAFKR